MATPFNIKRPYVTPAIEECFDCESEDWLMAGSPVTGTGPDGEQGEGDWSKSTDPSFEHWGDYDDFIDEENY